MTRRELAPGTPTVRLREPADVLAAIPYAMGYHPSDSIVVLAMRGKQLIFTARDDLPDQDSPWAPTGPLGEQLVRILRRERASGVILVGFGGEERVRPTVLSIRDTCEEAGLGVLEMLRADDGRYWSYVCGDPACCPPEGSPYDTRTSAVAAQWTLAGRVALPDREAYERQLDPVQGLSRLSMAQATERAGDLLFELVTRPIDEKQLEREFLNAAHTVVHDALVGSDAGGPLDDDQVAWLTLLLESDPVREAAWDQVEDAPELADALRNLWLDVMRRSEADLRAAPTALFAYAAWLCGESHLARVAVDQALEREPDHQGARWLQRALAKGMAPPDLNDPRNRGLSRRLGRRPRRRSSSRRARSRRA